MIRTIVIKNFQVHAKLRVDLDPAVTTLVGPSDCLKPPRLHNTPSVRTKAEAARNFCRTRGFKYLLLGVKKLAPGKIRRLFEQGVVKFLPRYEEKLRAQINNDQELSDS